MPTIIIDLDVHFTPKSSVQPGLNFLANGYHVIEVLTTAMLDRRGPAMCERAFFKSYHADSPTS